MGRERKYRLGWYQVDLPGSPSPPPPHPGGGVIRSVESRLRLRTLYYTAFAVCLVLFSLVVSTEDKGFEPCTAAFAVWRSLSLGVFTGDKGFEPCTAAFAA